MPNLDNTAPSNEWLILLADLYFLYRDAAKAMGLAVRPNLQSFDVDKFTQIKFDPNEPTIKDIITHLESLICTTPDAFVSLEGKKEAKLKLAAFDSFVQFRSRHVDKMPLLTECECEMRFFKKGGTPKNAIEKGVLEVAHALRLRGNSTITLLSIGAGKLGFELRLTEKLMKEEKMNVNWIIIDPSSCPILRMRNSDHVSEYVYQEFLEKANKDASGTKCKIIGTFVSFMSYLSFIKDIQREALPFELGKDSVELAKKDDMFFNDAETAANCYIRDAVAAYAAMGWLRNRPGKNRDTAYYPSICLIIDVINNDEKAVASIVETLSSVMDLAFGDRAEVIKLYELHCDGRKQTDVKMCGRKIEVTRPAPSQVSP